MKEIEATGGQIVAISYDSPAILKRFAANSAITYPLLSDAGSKTIDAYGIRNKEAPERFSGIPYPGTFVVDRRVSSGQSSSSKATRNATASRPLSRH